MAKKAYKAKRHKSLKQQSRASFDEQYSIKAIVNETEDQYEVIWENSWIPKEWANQVAIEYWHARKLQLAASPLSSVLSSVPDDGQLDKLDALYRVQESSDHERKKISYSTTIPQDTFEESILFSEHTSDSSPRTSVAESAGQTERTQHHSLYQPRPQKIVVSSTTQGSGEEQAAQARSDRTEVSQVSVSSYSDSSNIFVKYHIQPQTEESYHHTVTGSLNNDNHSNSTMSNELHSGSPALDQAAEPSLVIEESSLLSQPTPIQEENIQPSSEQVQHTTGSEESAFSQDVENISIKTASRSPSTVPARVEELEEEQHHQQQYETPRPMPLNTRQAEIIVIPMMNVQAQQYFSTARSLDDFTEQLLQSTEERVDQNMINQIEDILERLDNIALHPDLDNTETFTQYDIDSQRQAAWDRDCSAKFRFLEQVLAQNAQDPVDIGIIVPQPKLKHSLMKFLSGTGHLESDHVVLVEDDGPHDLDVVIDLNGRLSDIPFLYKKNDTLTRHVRVLAEGTVEHLELSLPKHPVPQYLRNLLNAMKQTTYSKQSKEGSLVKSAAQLLASSLKPLSRSKRELDTDDDLPTKKQKLEKAIPPMTAEMRLQEELQEYRYQVTELRDVVRAGEQRQFDYQHYIRKLRKECDDLETQLEDLTREKDDATTAVQRNVQRIDMHIKTIATLREDLATVKEQLKDASTRLADHTIPEKAELEQQRQLAGKAAEAELKATNRLTSIKKDLEYIQSLYQQASSQAQILAAEVQTLQERVAIAEKAAASQAAHYKQISLDNVSRKLISENKQLKTILNSREVLLRQQGTTIERLKKDNRDLMATQVSSPGPGSTAERVAAPRTPRSPIAEEL